MGTIDMFVYNSQRFDGNTAFIIIILVILILVNNNNTNIL